MKNGVFYFSGRNGLGAPGGVFFWGGVPSRLKQYAGWDFWLYVRVDFLRREFSTCELMGCVPTLLGLG